MHVICTAVAIVALQSAIHRQAAKKGRGPPVQCCESNSPSRHVIGSRDLQIKLQLFWNGRPFLLSNCIVQNVLHTGEVPSRLIHIIEPNANKQFDSDPFAKFYAGNLLSSIEAYQQAYNVDNNRSRKKRSFGLLLSYNGQCFCGWQRQPKNLKYPAVQEVIENVVESAFVENGRPDIRVSGRTDSGVHAVGQIARVRIFQQRTTNDSFKVTSDSVFDALNVAAKASNYTWRCLSVVNVSDKFHPTFDTQTRSYIYILDANAVFEFISTILVGDIENNVETVNGWLLVQFQNALNTQLETLVGKELDYYSLSYGKVKTETTLCCLQHAKVRIGKTVQPPRDHKMLIFEFTGNRFLRRMVRMLVGTCMQLAAMNMMKMPSSIDCNGYDPMPDDCIPTLIDICNSRDRTQLITAAPAGGLIFVGANLTVR